MRRAPFCFFGNELGGKAGGSVFADGSRAPDTAARGVLLVGLQRFEIELTACR